ncbi:hypothetical protein C2869_13085 [Saccharobesus litoralis]|uniref:Putative gluconeogenesis factor n=1 Tax=Saccharobesus litoralis TaxID=2172099 RepID=A0A2S0VSY8_9ALTE|nr:uridine diphosphate-N-acetylglucosamine-binding protein YvcK [Saccharobesus litoralis]AWB67317.1 hypothetical protein C2869_13085 [Saccharobesus litoralis]
MKFRQPIEIEPLMLTREFNIVAIGGGHGLGKVLNTFSDYGHRLTGIVTTTDNGGSTGRLRKAKDTIAWGDLRNCLSHLAGKNHFGAQLLEYRFEDDELSGHSLGNLLFFALQQLRYSPVEVIELARRMLKVESRLYPMSEQPAHLSATTCEGRVVVGETSIDAEDIPVPDCLNLTQNITAPPRAIRAIYNADYILLGPGSFFTSVIPPLLVNDLYQALAATNAKIIYIDNLGKEIGPAGKMNLAAKLEWLQRQFPKVRISKVLVDNHSPVDNLSDDMVIKGELRQQDIFYRHDELKLRQTMERVFASLAVS